MLFAHGPILVSKLLYLDPGSGSFIIQLLLGAGLGLAVGAKVYWRKIRSLFTGKKVEASTMTPPPDEIDEP